MILADYHLHTSFSTDSDAAPQAQADALIRAGIRYACFTDHEDIGFPGGGFTLDPGEYYPAICRLREENRDKLEIAVGAEIGLWTEKADEIHAFAGAKPWEFIIGSIHLVDGLDIYYPEFWAQGDPEDLIRLYYERMLEHVRFFDFFDVLGHIDYIIRVAPGDRDGYRWEKNKDLIDEILKTIIRRGKGIECNTAGYKYGLGRPNPEEAILARYRELGGRILTIGSDGHRPEHVAYAYDQVPALLKRCGFTEYTIFCERKPVFLPLD